MLDPSNEIATGAGHAAKRYFQKKFPYKSSRTYSDVEAQELKNRYGKWKIIAVAFALFYLLALMMAWGIALQRIHWFLYDSITSVPNIFFPENVYAFTLINGLFLSMATLGFATEGTLRLFLGNSYEEFNDFYNHTDGYDNNMAVLLLSKIGGILTFISLVFTFSARIVAKENTVIINTFLSVTTVEYAYKDVNRIVYFLAYENKAGAIRQKPHYRVYWQNGKEFNPNKYFNGETEAEPLISLLASRSHSVIDTIAVEPFKPVF